MEYAGSTRDLMGVEMLKISLLACLLITVAAPATAASPNDSPGTFVSTGGDRTAIEALLATYTRAVSTKDEALFRTLLLNEGVPFSDVYSAVAAKGVPGGTQRYEDFRKGVFAGPAFTQHFRDIHISQDGPLADVTLVFVNEGTDGESWGWKTMQLLKVNGLWKIASEFYTGHAGAAPRQH